MSFIERGKGPWPVNNQLHTVQRWIALRLGGGYEDREIQSVVRVLLDAVSSLDRGQRIVNDWKPNESALDTLARWCDRFKNGEPLQYILGESHFLGLTLTIDARALFLVLKRRSWFALYWTISQAKSPGMSWTSERDRDAWHWAGSPNVHKIM